MRTCAIEPVSPVAIPAKHSVSRRESVSLELVVDLAMHGFSVLGSTAVDVVDSEKVALSFSAAVAFPAVGCEHFVPQLVSLLLVVLADMVTV